MELYKYKQFEESDAIKSVEKLEHLGSIWRTIILFFFCFLHILDLT